MSNSLKSIIKLAFIIASPVLLIALYVFYTTTFKDNFTNNVTKEEKAITKTENPAIRGNVTFGKNDENSNAAKSWHNAVVEHYIQLKNNLVEDNSAKAADAGFKLSELFSKIDSSRFSQQQRLAIALIADYGKRHSENIGKYAGKISNQRNNFDLVSKDIGNLIKLYGANQELYHVYCPMYNNGNGAIWYSETAEIKNPYYGSQMLTCGKVVETIKQ